MDGGEDTKGFSKREKKKEGEEIVTAGKDDMRMEEDRLINGDEMEKTEESKESPKKEQQIIFIFSQQVISDH